MYVIISNLQAKRKEERKFDECLFSSLMEVSGIKLVSRKEHNCSWRGKNRDDKSGHLKSCLTALWRYKSHSIKFTHLKYMYRMSQPFLLSLCSHLKVQILSIYLARFMPQVFFLLVSELVRLRVAGVMAWVHEMVIHFMSGFTLPIREI